MQHFRAVFKQHLLLGLQRPTTRRSARLTPVTVQWVSWQQWPIRVRRWSVAAVSPQSRQQRLTPHLSKNS